MLRSYLSVKQAVPAHLSVFLMLFLFCVSFKGVSQDLRLFSMASPVSGCTLSNQENVSIVIINVGPQLLNASFDATYILNNGSPVTETVMLPPVFNNGSLISYTFNALADLSLPGAYTVDAYINLPSDVDRSNDTLATSTINSYPLTDGGDLSGSTSVCSGTNSGQLILTGYTGDILNWESSPDGVNWTSITNSSSTYSYSNLTATTHFRVQVKSGTCPQEASTTDTITVDPLSVGGNINSLTVCAGSSGTINLTGHTGDIIHWESSIDNGANWTILPNTTATQSYSSISVETMYRALVKSGVCSQVYSITSTISLLPATVGGTTSSSDTVCSGINSGTITLSGYTGNILRWERSIDGGTSWLNVPNTSGTLSYSNLTTTTHYRAVVESCAPPVNSTTTIITVNPAPVGGTLSGTATVCATSNSGTLTLSGSSGTITWQSSPDGIAWNSIPGSTPTYSYSNLLATTYFRVMLSSSSCQDVYSNTVTITVDEETKGGSITGSTTECIAGNTGTLELTQYTGTIANWERSEDNGVTWLNITNTTSSQAYLNLTITTLFRARVQSGVCGTTYSDTATVSVVSAAFSGTISGNDSVCSGSTADLTLTGYQGMISEWQYSTDTISWQTIANTSSGLTFSSFTGTTYFRSIVATGSCPADTSQPFRVDLVTLSITVSSDTTISKGTQVMLQVSGGQSYSWEPSSSLTDPLTQTPLAEPVETTTYTVLATGAAGCLDTGYVVVNVIDDSEVLIPNFISPNGDGINDTWEIKGISTELRATIFNSNGQVIFEANPYTANWDGTVKGVAAPDGTYFYRLIGTDQNGSSVIYKGNINIKSR